MTSHDVTAAAACVTVEHKVVVCSASMDVTYMYMYVAVDVIC